MRPNGSEHGRNISLFVRRPRRKGKELRPAGLSAAMNVSFYDGDKFLKTEREADQRRVPIPVHATQVLLSRTPSDEFPGIWRGGLTPQPWSRRIDSVYLGERRVCCGDQLCLLVAPPPNVQTDGTEFLLPVRIEGVPSRPVLYIRELLNGDWLKSPLPALDFIHIWPLAVWPPWVR